MFSSPDAHFRRARTWFTVTAMTHSIPLARIYIQRWRLRARAWATAICGTIQNGTAKNTTWWSNHTGDYTMPGHRVLTSCESPSLMPESPRQATRCVGGNLPDLCASKNWSDLPKASR